MFALVYQKSPTNRSNPALLHRRIGGLGTMERQIGLVALTNNREYLGVELNPQYAEMSVERIGLGAELG